MTFTNRKDIAELFHRFFFVNIGPTLAKKTKTDHTDPAQYIKSTPVNSFYLAPVTQVQVFALFAGFKDNKASLNVPNQLIKFASELFSMPFTRIYNESILSGEVPAIFKISKVTPIFKSGSMSDLGNYLSNRPQVSMVYTLINHAGCW